MKTSLFLGCALLLLLYVRGLENNSNNEESPGVRSLLSSSDRFSAPEEADDKKCDCGEFSSNCEFVEGRKKCTCLEGYGEKFPKLGDPTCAKCDCGKNGLNCRIFEGTGKFCKCKFGKYTDSFGMRPDQKCKECNCGPDSISCDFDSKYKIFCKCKSGYSSEKESEYSDDEYCKLCECGQNGVCKVRDVGNRSKKECICNAGYVEVDGKCKRCDCGGSTDCRYDTGLRKCECKEGYANKAIGSRDQYCDKCDCGEFGETCEFLFSTRKCTCKEGYIANDYEGDMNDYCKKKTWFAGWMIAVIVVGVGLLVAVGAIVFIKMRSRRV